MLKRIHINQHIIRRNQRTGERLPVITVKTYKSNEYYHNVNIDGPCTVIYSPGKPLSCGATVWIETNAEINGNKCKSALDDQKAIDHAKSQEGER